MDQHSISKLILELRKKNNLTQEKFAQKIMVTPQAVSKWENGRGIPDIEILKKISQEFDIDINELITGKKKIGKTDKKKLIILAVALISLILIIFFIVSYKNDYTFKTLTSENKEFSISGVAAYSNDKKSIYITNIQYKNDNGNSDSEYIAMECSLYETHNNTDTKLSQYGNIEKNYDKTYSLADLLSKITLNVDNYTSSCKTIKNNELSLVIYVKDQKDKVYTYKIPLNLNDTCNK
jgi:transcriptional regulator with XRE-family HTH domain